MRLTRVAAAATSLALFAASATIGSAGAASTGVGTSKASTTILDVAVGTDGALLGLRLLGDDSQSTIDAKTATAPEAFSKLTALSATSTVLQGADSNDLNLAVGELESRQPGGDADVNNTPISLSVPGVPVPAGFGNVLTGTLSLAHLTSAVEAAAARSSLDASLTSLSVVGGLLNVDAVSSKSGTESVASSSSSSRSAAVDAITVLDLGAVLDGLGISISDLSVAQVDALIAALDTQIAGLGVGVSLQDTINAIEDQKAALLAAVGGTLPDPGDVVTDLGLDALIPGTVLDALPDASDPQALVDQLSALLDGALADILGAALEALDTAPLLSLEGVEIAVNTKAADTAANSVAEVVGKIGAVNVGGIELPGIDLVQTADTVNGLVGDINDAIGGVLSTIEATIGTEVVNLSDLVTVEVLKSTKSITEANGYNVAQAGITGVTATINPPADDVLAAIQAAIDAAVTAGETVVAAIEGVGGEVPALSSAMSDLEATLGGSIDALADGATVNAVQVLGVSEFKVNAAPVTPGNGGSLPATGSGALRLGALGMLLVALGLGLGRWYEMPTPAWVKDIR